MKHLNATYEIYSKFCAKFTYVLVSEVGLFIVIRSGAVNEKLKMTKVNWVHRYFLCGDTTETLPKLNRDVCSVIV